jgi:hypothetical protein
MQTMPGIDGVVALGDPWPEGVDAVVPAMTLPHLLGTDTVEDIPWDGPYLSGDKARFASPNDGTLRVGLCWAGQSRPDARMAEVDRRRSVRLEQMAPLAKVPGVRFVSLQIGDGLSQVIAPPGMHVQDYSQSLEDFYDTACLIATLDLVISVDTAVAHLAAAMGKPVWLLSRFDNCWRWLGKRADSPWYPSLVQFCQPRWGDWEPVMMEVARKLSALTALRVAV